MKAWLFQDHRQKQKLGDKCPWSVGWIDPEGRRRSRSIGRHSLAEKFQRKIEGQLASGTYQSNTRKQWADFRSEYTEKRLALLRPGSRESANIALDHFERLIKPHRVSAIKTADIDNYKAQRLTEQRSKDGPIVSVCTVNRELRSIKAALRKAYRWKYLPEVPYVEMLKEPVKIPRYCPPDDFARIYQACDVAVRPRSDAYTPGDWWRALIVYCYMTGWRISEPLSLCWDDVSLDQGQATTRAENNQGGRDEVVGLHPPVVDHLRQIADIEPMVFNWPHNRRTLWVDFHRIQKAAGIENFYGFHDLRRAFATNNATMMTADALQKIMRHRSYTTTQRYITLADQVKRATENLFVPSVLQGTKDLDGN